MDKILSKLPQSTSAAIQSPYERLDLGPAVCPQDYTGDVIHDTLGRRISPSLLQGP